jgi:hypothetical protein
MAGARGDQDCVRFARDMFLFFVEDKLGLTLLDAEELINGHVHCVTDLFDRLQAHHDELDVLTREQYPAEV